MRHYDRLSYRHLNDSNRYRDHEYLADDGWVGANEHVREPNVSPGEEQILRRLMHEPLRGGEERGRARATMSVRGALRELRDAVRRPGALVRRVVATILLGAGHRR
jgi:hypothetical protein